MSVFWKAFKVEQLRNRLAKDALARAYAVPPAENEHQIPLRSKKRVAPILKVIGLVLIVLVVGAALISFGYGMRSQSVSTKQATDVQPSITPIPFKSPDWNEYYLNKDKFKISFPTEPTQSKMILRVSGNDLSFDEFKSTKEGTYTVFYTNISQALSDTYPAKTCPANVTIESLDCDYYNRRRSINMSNDVYNALFQRNKGVREITQYQSNGLNFQWKNTENGEFTKGRIIIVDDQDCYIVQMKDDQSSFVNFDYFVSSLQSFGRISE